MLFADASKSTSNMSTKSEEEISAEMYQTMFDKSKAAQDIQFTEEESTKFKKAFDDPEFRKMFADYMDEIQDPANREETEAYISQLEGDKKVPTGKELIQ